MSEKIKKIEYYLPKQIIANEDLKKRFKNWDSVKAEKNIGVKQRCVVSADETSLDLAIKASNKALKEYDKNKIDMIIFCTQSPDYYLPSGACIIQHRLGLRKNIGAFDITLGCSGYVYGLALAKSFIITGIASHVLLITADVITKLIDSKDIANISLFGDASTTTIIERSNINGIGEFSVGTDGSGYQNLIMRYGGMKHHDKYVSNNKNKNINKNQTSNSFFMDGPEIFNFTIDVIPPLINDILMKNNKTMNDIKYFILHQANQFILNYLRKKLEIPKEKFYTNMLNTGNTSSSSIPLAIRDCLDNQVISEGDIILIAGFGVGYSWAGTVIQL